MEDWTSVEDALPLPPVLDLYWFLLGRKVRPFFITARTLTKDTPDITKDAATLHTMDQLKKAGYQGGLQLALMPPPKSNVAENKDKARKSLSTKGHIVLNIGNNDYDFENKVNDPLDPLEMDPLEKIKLQQPPKGLNKKVLRALIQEKLDALRKAKRIPSLPAIVPTEPKLSSSSSSSSPLSSSSAPRSSSSGGGVGSSSSLPSIPTLPLLPTPTPPV